MALRRVSTTQVPLTRALAQRFSTMAPLPGERPRKEGRLNFFLQHLKDGTFESPTWHKVRVKGEEGEYRADGQHTSTALTQCPEEHFPIGQVVGITEWEIDSIAKDGAALFNQFDHPRSVRNTEDMTWHYRAGFPDLEGVPPWALGKVGAALKLLKQNTPEREKLLIQSTLFGDIRPVEPRNVGLLFTEATCREAALWVWHWHDHHNNWILREPPVVLEVMLRGWLKKPTEAEAFWEEVFTGSNPDPESPSRLLVEALKDTQRIDGKRKTERCRKASEKCWREYQTGITGLSAAA